MTDVEVVGVIPGTDPDQSWRDTWPNKGGDGLPVLDRRRQTVQPADDQVQEVVLSFQLVAKSSSLAAIWIGF